MNFSEIAVYTTSEMAEVVAYFLQEVCMDGVSIYDIKDLYDNPSWDYKEEGIELQYASEVVVKGYCNLEDTDSVLHFLRQSLSGLTDAGSLDIVVNTVDGNAWVDSFRKTFRPIETERLVICPEWQSVETPKTVFLMDSGVAFGTGQHETTSMCLEILEKLNLTGKKVLDVGCGSGILGLCALLLGAKQAELVDIDVQATDVAKHNAEINGLTQRATVKTGNLTEQTSGKFDIVFANLTADILQLLRADIAQVVKRGTLLVLSGILDVKLDGVLALYCDIFQVLEIKQKGEWRALILKRK
ncbi:MAG: 50S ribosomal protein L11 methyltransferase [Clostridiales bacterium]|nr:50S ribosomal protein L11 methyltransferase [Clostridiales bacterium]